MKRILVTGSDGQLGKCIQKIAPNYLDFLFTFATSRQLDIRNIENTRQYFNDNNLDFCINCAAYTNVEQAEITPELAFQVNAEGVKNLSELCKTNGVILIHISTDYVFDGQKKNPYTTEDKPNPINEYGSSKLLGEQYIKEILSQYIIIRSSWLYSEFGQNFYTKIMEKSKSEAKIIVTDAEKACPTNANNLALYILELIANSDLRFGTHHFTDGKIMSWYDFAFKILKEIGLEEKLEPRRDMNYRTFAKRPKNSALK